MAISAPHYRLFKSLKPILPQGGTLLEIGEANWYGDVEPDFLRKPSTIVCEGRHLDTARKLLESPPNFFDIAKAFYAALFAPSKTVAIDFNGSETALRLDLNAPIDLGEQFDLVINHGTAEHIFNIAQVFKTMHDHCIGGGLMIHESPFTGWIDHGFYCLQPTLFYDLAAANCYEIVLVAIEEINANVTTHVESRDHIPSLAAAGKIPNNAMLFAVYRKRGDRAFRVPMQGYYDGRLSEAGVKSWERNR